VLPLLDNRVVCRTPQSTEGITGATRLRLGGRTQRTQQVMAYHAESRRDIITATINWDQFDADRAAFEADLLVAA
jgi:hypothetical protein